MELIKSISIDNLISQRNAIEERVIKAHALIMEAKQISEASKIANLDLLFRARYSYSEPPIFEKNGIKNFMKELDASAWDHLMSESGMKSFMSAKTREKWTADLEKGEHPPLTVENIAATFANLHHSRHDMLEEGIVECFKQLSWDYKTNSPRKFGKRIIVGRLFDSYGCLNHRACDQIDDLLRAFSIMLQKPEPAYDQRVYSQIYNRKREFSFFENEFIHIRWFKKGSGHITFKRLDLVQSCNKILAKYHPNALPPETR